MYPAHTACQGYQSLVKIVCDSRLYFVGTAKNSPEKEVLMLANSLKQRRKTATGRGIQTGLQN